MLAEGLLIHSYPLMAFWSYSETIEEDLWTAADGSKYYIPPKTAYVARLHVARTQ